MKITHKFACGAEIESGNIVVHVGESTYMAIQYGDKLGGIVLNDDNTLSTKFTSGFSFLADKQFKIFKGAVGGSYWLGLKDVKFNPGILLYESKPEKKFYIGNGRTAIIEGKTIKVGCEVYDRDTLKELVELAYDSKNNTTRS